MADDTAHPPAPETCPENLSFWGVLKATFKEWSDDHASRLAAAFAYYAIFSIGPLLLIAITLVTLVYGPKAEQDQIRPQLTQFVGDNAANLLQGMLQKARESAGLSVTGIFSILLTIYAATNLFAALQDALNTIFDVQPKPGRGIKGILRDRGMTFIMVLLIGAFVLASIVLNTYLAGFTKWGADRVFPNHPQLAGFLIQLGSFLASAIVFTGIFALIFKYLPDVKIDWKDTLIGAVATSLLFTIARVGLAFYLSRASTTSPFGAAGSLVVVMLFIYYSAQVMFLGAEFTQIWACRSGKPITASDNAVFLGKKHARRNDQKPAKGKPKSLGPAMAHATRGAWWPAHLRVEDGHHREKPPREKSHEGRTPPEPIDTTDSTLRDVPLDEPYPATKYHPPMS
jgi:membrane protein